MNLLQFSLIFFSLNRRLHSNKLKEKFDYHCHPSWAKDEICDLIPIKSNSFFFAAAAGKSPLELLYLTSIGRAPLTAAAVWAGVDSF